MRWRVRWVFRLLVIGILAKVGANSVAVHYFAAGGLSFWPSMAIVYEQAFRDDSGA
jgi:hypothetical protein